MKQMKKEIGEGIRKYKNATSKWYDLAPIYNNISWAFSELFHKKSSKLIFRYYLYSLEEALLGEAYVVESPKLCPLIDLICPYDERYCDY